MCVMKPCSILLVDDFEDGLEILLVLTYRGFHVVAARNGEETSRTQARLHRPDVILLDLRMPGMTGTEAMRILRADPYVLWQDAERMRAIRLRCSGTPNGVSRF